MPYINASIIFQLLVMAVPALEALQKEGEWGQRKIMKWTKYSTVGLALLQAGGFITIFKGMGGAGSTSLFSGGPAVQLFDMLMMTAGTCFLMFLGDKITENGIGQGISLIIFAGIMTSLPGQFAQTVAIWRTGTIGLPNLMFLALIFVATVYVIVYFQQAQRKIPVQYAKRVKGNRVYGGTTSYLPLRVNQAGVIPIIFAIAVIMFPATIAQVFTYPAVMNFFTKTLHLSSDSIGSVVSTLRNFMPGPAHNGASLFYFILVIVFTYFYTAVTFNPEQIAENLQKSGGTIPGVRPGAKTRDYLDRILYRITLAGALFLGVVALMQYYVGAITGITSFSLVGGTSLLIVVGVALDTMQQIEAQLMMRHYRGFLSS
jgi:preprotein translocase subunit SecY